jgi:hypothetical protein
MNAAPPRPAVEQHGRLDGIGVEQIQDWAKGALKVGQLVLVSPPGGPVTEGGVQEVRRPPRLERRLDLVADLILSGLDEFDFLAGLLLDRGDNFPDRLVHLRVDALLPPDDEVGAASAERH